MRQKRAKAYRKLMHLYCHFFGFHQPYQVLVDAETCRVAISHNIDIVKQLGTVLQGEVKPMITQCCIHELYLQGKVQQPATDLAKSFERRRCNHKTAIPGDDCLLSVVGDKNKHRYVITTQSQPLRVQLRTIPAAPIVHITRSVVVLEPPSDVTLQTKAKAEEQVLHATVLDKDHATVLDKDHTTTSAPESPPKKKKRPQGPNPLSVKKKKVALTCAQPKTKHVDKEAANAGLKRKRENTISDPEVIAQDNTLKKRRRKHKGASTQPSGSS